MIKAIIFDCFGVLTYDGWLPFKRQHFAANTKDEQHVTDLVVQVNRGILSYDDFITRLADLAQVSTGEARKAIHDNVPNEELFAYIRKELKPHYKIGLLSNAGRNMLEDIFSPAHLAVFDAMALSYEMGYVKPERQSYETAIQRLGVEPEECVFVDDQQGHCTGAQDAGMQTVLYTSFDEFKPKLEALLNHA